MKRWTVALTFILGLSLSLSADDKLPSIHDIMEKAHEGKQSLRQQIADQLKKPTPDWANVQKNAKEFVSLAEALAKHPSPKGDKSSWTKLTKEYAEQVKDLEKTAAKKDLKATNTANQKLGANCMGCHDAHRD
jgi:type I site-specific restriction-modification system R (restriction) subunit